jgi:two-component system, NarL family, sensor kinase
MLHARSRGLQLAHAQRAWTGFGNARFAAGQELAMDDATTLAQRNRELSILNTIAADLNRETDLERALTITLRHVAELCGLRTGWVWLLDETGEAMLAASCNLPPALASAPERMCGSCYCLDTYRAGAMDGADNISIVTCSRLKPLVDGTDGLRFHASIPLFAHGRRLGVLNVASTSWQRISPDELRLLATAGDLLSIAIERARLFARSAEIGALEERNRIAREIHDTLAQSLAAITLKLDVADALLEGGVPATDVRRPLGEAMQLARHSLEDARRSVMELRAAPDEASDLPAALRALVQRATRGTNLAASVDVVGEPEVLPLRTRAALYRIACEAVTNVVRHANASRLTVQLVVGDERVELAIGDDGRGFVPNSITPGRFGLVGMNERARLLGGVLQVQSAPGAGTTIVVAAPR